MEKTKQLLADTRCEANEKTKFNLENVGANAGKLLGFVEFMIELGHIPELHLDTAKEITNDFNALLK